MDRESAPELYTIWDEARSYIKSGNHDKAVEIYKYILVRYGDDLVVAEHAHAYLADIFLNSQNLDLAESHIKKAIDYAPDKPGYHYILGFVYSYQRQWDKAIPEFEIATAREPNNGEYLRGLGWAKYHSENQTEGLELLHRANDLAPDNVNVLADLAVAYLATDIDKARKYAEQAVAIDPQSVIAQEVLSNILSADKYIKHVIKGIHAGAVRPRVNNSGTVGIYRFKVSLRDNPNIWRIIETKENQMLSSLHKAIFKAFNHSEERQYSFFMSNRPYDKDSEYTSSDVESAGTARLASRIRIDSLALHPGQKFLYLFDYVDKWWHEVELIEVKERISRGNYPRLLKKQGKSPLKYPRNV